MGIADTMRSSHGYRAFLGSDLVLQEGMPKATEPRLIVDSVGHSVVRSQAVKQLANPRDESPLTTKK